MSAKDIYHKAVVNALVKDGWIITDDPLILSYGNKEVYVDLGAEYPIGAERNDQKIAVEIKSFISPSDVRDLEMAIGQYNLYRDILSETEPDRTPYVAVPIHAYKGIFTDPLGQLVVKRQQMNLIVFDGEQEQIVQWIP